MQEKRTSSLSPTALPRSFDCALSRSAQDDRRRRPQAAGISKGTLYYYYKNKNDILFDIDQFIAQSAELIRQLEKLG